MKNKSSEKIIIRYDFDRITHIAKMNMSDWVYDKSTLSNDVESIATQTSETAKTINKKMLVNTLICILMS